MMADGENGWRSGAAGDALSEMARRMGPGVCGLSFRIEAGGAVLTPDLCDLAASDGPDGGIVLTGRHEGIRVAWEFTPRDGGVSVRLSAAADRPLHCARVESLAFRYAPDRGILSGWYVPTLGTEITEAAMPRVADLTEKPGRLWRGVFPNSRDAGLFAGTLLPQRMLHRFTVTPAGEDAVDVVCATLFPEGVSAGREVRSETTWVCASKSAAQAVATYASFVPETESAEAPPAGWNSWDYYFSTVTLDDMIENMDEIRRDPALSDAVRTIVVDMGWEHKEGEWFANYKFPGGMERLAREIAGRGFVPGVWTSPLLVQSLSLPALRSPEMLVKNEYGDPESHGGMYLVDPTHPAGREHLRGIYTRLHGAGFRFFKVDYLSPMLGVRRFHDPSAGPYDALAGLMRLIRECVGDSHILGCSLPPECGPGLVESGRTGIDIHNQWSHVTWAFDYWTLSYWMHRRIWVNDPDFLIVRGKDTSLETETNVTNPQAHHPNPGRWRRGPVFTADEARTWATVVLLAGGSIFLSDRLAMLNEAGREMLRRAVVPEGISARPLDLCDGERASLWLQPLPGETRLAVINWADAPATRRLSFAEMGLSAPPEVTDFWTDEKFPVEGGGLALSLAPHATAYLRWA